MNEPNPVTPANPTTEVTPPVAQAPATTTAPVEPKPSEPVATKPAEPVQPALPTEQLLKVEPIKPTVEALKLPENHLVPAEALAEIVSQSKTVEEAQAKAEMMNGVYAGGAKRLELQNQTWLTELKGDAELGGQKWDETKALYQAGVKRLFGEGLIKKLVDAKLDAMPEFVRGVVRAERAAGVKPIVKGDPTPLPPKPKTPAELVYGPEATYNEKNPAQPLTKPRW